MQSFSRSSIRIILVSACIVAWSSAVAAQPGGEPEAPDKQQQEPAQQRQAQPERDAPVVWSFDAQLRPRAEARTNHSFGLEPDERAYFGRDTFATISQRTRLGLGAELDELSAYAQLQHAGEWGLTGGDALTDPVVGLHQAWLNYAPSEQWSLRAGRQELAYGDQRVLGTVGWSQTGRAWDAVRLGVQPNDALGFDLFVGRYAAGAVESDFALDSSLFDGDAYLTGAYFTVRDLLEPAFDELDVYALYDAQIDDLSDDDPNRQNRVGLGARLAGKWNIVDATVEGMYQLGSQCVADDDGCTDETTDISAWFIDSELGVMAYEPNAVRLFVGFSHATGDDPETADTDEGYFQFYPTAHKWLGFMDIIGPRTNIQEVRGGLGLRAGSFNVRESVHYFRRLEPEAETVGLEFDTTVSTKLTDELALGVGHGLFLPSEGASTNGDAEGAANWFYVQMNAAF